LSLPRGSLWMHNHCSLCSWCLLLTWNTAILRTILFILLISFQFRDSRETIFCASSSVSYVLAATYANLIKAIAYLTSQTIYCGFRWFMLIFVTAMISETYILINSWSVRFIIFFPAIFDSLDIPTTENQYLCITARIDKIINTPDFQLYFFNTHHAKPSWPLLYTSPASSDQGCYNSLQLPMYIHDVQCIQQYPGPNHDILTGLASSIQRSYPIFFAQLEFICIRPKSYEPFLLLPVYGMWLITWFN